MNIKVKALLIGAAMVIGLSLRNPTSAANFTSNVNWCTTNSGTINVSYQECVGLAHLYNETNGDNWVKTGNWFSSTDLSTWLGGDLLGTGALKISGGHVTRLDLWSNRLSGNIMTGLIYLPYLTHLDLSANYGITGVNLSQNTGLLVLSIGSSDLTSLNITMLTGLKVLSVGGGLFTGINVTQNINLTGFSMFYTPVTYVDVSKNTQLQWLALDLNALTGLDVSGLTGLVNLSAAYQSGRNMKYTNFSGATRIYQLWLSDNGLTGINVLPIGSALSILKLDYNNLTELSVTGNTSLTYLNLIGSGNRISSLDLTNNYYLGGLFLGNGNTGLTYLDISYNTGLINVSTSGIAITGFNIATTTNYRSDLVVDFFGNAFVDSTLSLAQLWFLNQHYIGWGYRGIPGPGVTYSLGGGGGGGGGSAPSSSSQTNTTGTAATGTISNTGSITWMQDTGAVATPRVPLTKESDVYLWAFANNITTLPLAKARLHDTIQRYEAAKMIVNFAENIMQTRIEHNPLCDVSKYGDVKSFDAEMKEYITKACDLGLMGWAVRNEKLMASFRPFDTLTANEFGIVIGRYLGESPSKPATSKRVDIMRFLNRISIK